METIIIQIIAVLIPALLEYLIWFVIKAHTKVDYSQLILAIIILFITITPLVVVLFGNFDSEFFRNYLEFSNNYLTNLIVGTILGYLFIKIFSNFS